MVTLSELIVSMVSGNTSVISLVGAGGKSSLLYSICDGYLKQHPQDPCIATTTTHMFLPESSRYRALPIDSYQQGPPYPKFIYSQPSSIRGKVKGVTALQAATLIPEGQPGLIVCESDGSHRLPIKAPREDEPVHPCRLDLCIGIIGLSALGRTITSSTVHRLDHFLEVTGTEVGDIITAQVVKALAADRERGLFKGIAKKTPALLLLNQADLLSGDQREEVFETLKGLEGMRLCIASVLQDRIYHLV